MSDHEQQDKIPSDDNKGKSPPPKKLSKGRMALWEQAPEEPPPLRPSPTTKPGGSGQTVRPSSPPPRPNLTPTIKPGSSGEGVQSPSLPPPQTLTEGSSQPNRSLLKPKKGYERPRRIYLRQALDFELPQQPELTLAIKQKMIDSVPLQQEPLLLVEPPQPIEPVRRRRLGPPPAVLRRTDGVSDLGGMAQQAWTQLHDNAINKIQAFVDGFNQAKTQKRSTLGNQGLTALRLDLIKKANEADTAADRFLSIKAPGQDQGNLPKHLQREKRRPELARLQKAVEARLPEVAKLRKAIEDLFADTGQGPDDLGQALDAKQRGIRFSDLKLTQYGDDKLDRGQSKEDFAGGVMNKVSKLVYGDETRIFKSEMLTTTSKANQIGICGIDKSAPRFGNRNIATKAMSNVIGGNVIPDSCFTIHDGKIGLLMEEAKGEEMKDFKKTGFNPKPPSEDLVASLHTQLNQLEWTDMLTGQGDRHDGNYMIDANPNSIKITGIDNDFCFGKNQDDYSKYGSSPDAGPARGGRRGGYWGYNSAEMPPLIDKNVYDSLIAKDFDRDVKPNLIGLLTDEEIGASKQRFAQMQQHARSLSPAYVVADWKQWRSPQNGEPAGVNASEFLKGNKAITMFQRDFKDLM